MDTSKAQHDFTEERVHESKWGLPEIVWVRSLAEAKRGRVQVKATAMEIDRIPKALPVAEAAGMGDAAAVEASASSMLGI